MTEITSEQTVAAAPSTVQPVSLSDSAVRRIRKLRRLENTDAHVRVQVNGGGCSGFSYQFSFDSTVNDDDRVIERDGVSVVIDEMSLEFLAGSEIDFVEDLTASAFRITNPNATASCGCGNSFAV